MIHLEEFLWCFSIISFCFHILHYSTRVFYKTVSCISSSSSASSSASFTSSFSSSSPPTLPWMHFCSPLPIPNGGTHASKNFSRKNLRVAAHHNDGSPSDSSVLVSKTLVLASEEAKSHPGQHDYILVPNSFCFEMKRYFEEISSCSNENSIEKFGNMASERLNSSPSKSREVKVSTRAWKRPARIIIPASPVTDFGDVAEVLDNKDFETQGRDFFLASRRGRRRVMEDGYSAITDILRDPKQAFFGVFDGHGGRAAVDYAAENLGKNIVVAIGEVRKAGDQLEQAISKGYLMTDKDFLSKGQSSGACAATVLLKDGELYVANAGDCRVVLSRKGVADALTSDHHVNREDERFRIENLGGYVNCRNGVWRVQDSLAVSRAIGDLNLKEWVISEPEIKKLQLTPDCEILILASDGLWDKVNNQEAVDVALRHKSTIESCKKLVDLSSSRGNKDDTTVMVVNLHNFVKAGEPP